MLDTFLAGNMSILVSFDSSRPEHEPFAVISGLTW